MADSYFEGCADGDSQPARLISASTLLASPAPGGRQTLMRVPEMALEQIRVASPCSASWDAMEGNDRVRFCGECRKQVYNLSGMSREQAERLVRDNEYRLCVRYYRRGDGSILTADCPVGLAAMRRQMVKAVVASITILLSLVTICLRTTRAGEAAQRLMNRIGAIAPVADSPPAKERLGGVRFMGKICTPIPHRIPKPNGQPASGAHVMGSPE